MVEGGRQAGRPLVRRRLVLLTLGVAVCVLYVCWGYVYFMPKHTDCEQCQNKGQACCDSPVKPACDHQLAVPRLSADTCGTQCTPSLPAVRYLIYNRVPKCGSRTMRYLVARLADSRPFAVQFVAGGEKEYQFDREAQWNVSQTLLQNHSSIFIKHMLYIDFSQLGLSNSFTFINLIRDPLERFVSAFYFARKPERILKYGFSMQRVNVTLNECVNTNYQECTDPSFIFRIIPFFCGYDLRCRQPTHWALARAKQNVEKHFPVVGYLENINQFLEVLEYIWPQFFQGAREAYKDMMTGETRQFYRHPTSRKERLSAHNTRVMQHRMGLEYDFYHFIKQRFFCTYRNMCNGG